jgi:hypothetical protein
MFDNEQVLHYSRDIDAQRILRTLVITMTAFVQIGMKDLQKDVSLKPKLLMKLKDISGNAS